MARRIPENRFDQLVRSATQVFIERGYRLTQMSDIADAVGVAKGTLYGYVESKDALLALCLLRADETEAVVVPDVLPLPALTAGALGNLVRIAVEAEVSQPRLEEALACASPKDFSAELFEVVAELFDLMSANRHRIKLLDRCMDHPELEGLWQTRGRENTRAAFARYLRHRIETGHLEPISNLRLTARIALETCATWAVHIHWDRSPESFDRVEARRETIRTIVRGIAGHVSI